MTDKRSFFKTFSVLMAAIMMISVFAPAASAAEISSKEYYVVDEPRYYDNAVSYKTSAGIADKIDLKKLRAEVFEFFYNCPVEKNKNGTSNPDAYLDISEYKIPLNERSVISSLIWHEWTELFHIGPILFSYNTDDNLLTGIAVTEYNYQAEEYHRMLKVCEREADRLLSGIKGNYNLTDLEKVLLIHDRLAANTEYDYDDFLAGTLEKSVYNIYGVLGNRTAVCAGYALANIYLLEKVGVKAAYCSSDAMNHAWNIVYIDGIPYHVDVTHDDPTWDVSGRVKHNNFLLSSAALYNNTSHKANDYNTEPTSTFYDNYFWQDSDTEFRLVDGKIYYINNSDATIYRIDGNIKTPVLSVKDKWKVSETLHYTGNYSKLSSYGNYLLYSLSNAVYRYDVNTGESTVFWTPEKPGNYYNIYGFTYDGTYLICEVAPSPNFDENTKAVYQQKALFDLTSPSVSITVSNDVAASQTLTFDLYDEGVLSGYYWGTSRYYNANNFTAITGSLTQFLTTEKVSQEGTYYLTAADKSGNLSYTYMITFVKTTLYAAPGSVSPSYVITAVGNSFPLPKAERTYYENLGWSVDQTKTVSYNAGEFYRPETSATLYAVWSKYKLGDVDNNGEITAADARLALRRAVNLEKFAAGSEKFLACDVDKNNEVTASDARIILRIAVGLERITDY
ncbi:MAG: hypothetical protein J1E34_02545 [Oscillospiraceae bacterium]|nr:hypothetical protein [Oscillospiraceae bacterium]